MIMRRREEEEERREIFHLTLSLTRMNMNEGDG